MALNGKKSAMVDDAAFMSSWADLDLLGLDDDSKPRHGLSDKYAQMFANREKDLLSKSEHIPSTSGGYHSPYHHHQLKKPTPTAVSPRRRVLNKQLSESKMDTKHSSPSVRQSPQRKNKKSTSPQKLEKESMAAASPRKNSMTKSSSFRNFDLEGPAVSPRKHSILTKSSSFRTFDMEGSAVSPRKNAMSLMKKLSLRNSKKNVSNENGTTAEQQQQPKLPSEEQATARKLVSGDSDEQIEKMARGSLLKRLSSRKLSNADGTERASSPLRTMVKSLSLRSLCCTNSYAIMDDDEIESTTSSRRRNLTKATSLNDLHTAAAAKKASSCKDNDLDLEETTISTEFDISSTTLLFESPIKRPTNKVNKVNLNQRQATDGALKAMLEKKPIAKSNKHSSDNSTLSGLHSALMYNPPPSSKRSPKVKKNKIKTADLGTLSALHSAVVFDATSSPRRSSIVAATVGSSSSPRHASPDKNKLSVSTNGPKSDPHHSPTKESSAPGARQRDSERSFLGFNSSPRKSPSKRPSVLRKQLSERFFGSKSMDKESAFEPPSSVSTEPVKRGKARKLVLDGGDKKPTPSAETGSPRRPSDFSCHSAEGDSSVLHGGFAQIAFAGKDEECSVYISPSSGHKKAISSTPKGLLLLEEL